MLQQGPVGYGGEAQRPAMADEPGVPSSSGSNGPSQQSQRTPPLQQSTSRLRHVERWMDMTSSSFNLVPANIKVKKSVGLGLLPLRLSGSVVWNLESHKVHYKMACKDKILHGKLSVDVEQRALQYRWGCMHAHPLATCAKSMHCGWQLHIKHAHACMHWVMQTVLFQNGCMRTR